MAADRHTCALRGGAAARSPQCANESVIVRRILTRTALEYSTRPHASIPSARCIRIRFLILELFLRHSHRDHSLLLDYCAPLTMRVSDLVRNEGGGAHAGRPRSTLRRPPRRPIESLGACACAHASSERGHCRSRRQAVRLRRQRPRATSPHDRSSSSSSLAPIISSLLACCEGAPPEPIPRAHTRARARTHSLSHAQPPPHSDAFEVTAAQALFIPPLLPTCNCTPSSAGMSSHTPIE